MPIWLQATMSLVAAFIGGAISPHITQTKDRRAARAEVRRRVAEVDVIRWEGGDEYRRSLAAFESAAILARVPRVLVRLYVEASDAAQQPYIHYIDQDDTSPVRQAEDELRFAVEMLARHLWHPWLSWFQRPPQRPLLR